MTTRSKETKQFCGNVLHYMDDVIYNKRQVGKEGTACIYEATRSRLALFCHQQPLALKNITPHVVYSFEEYLRSNHLGINSVTNYMSVFRSVYNRAILESLVHPLVNPFRNLKLRPVSTYKRSVSMTVLMDMARLDLDNNSRLAMTRDLFLFCFMACGMTFIDLVHLTRNNIINNTIVYRRIKTNTEIRISITAGMQRILDRYMDKNSYYLFPILKKDSTYAQYKVALRTFNRRLERIAKMLPYDIKLTSYVARHSWAMQAKENNVSVAAISESMGHTSEKTTRFYLKNLDQSVLDKANKRIVSALDKWILKSNWLI